MFGNLFRKRIKSRSLTIYIRRIVIFSTLLMTIIVAAVVSIHQVLVFRKISEEQQKVHLAEHKEFVRDLINIEVSYIASQKRMFDDKMMQAVKQNVLYATKVADNLYKTYHEQMEPKALKELIIQTTASIENGHNYMDVFINNLNGEGVYYSSRPDYIGSDLYQMKDINGNSVIQHEIEFLKDNDEGFVRYGDENEVGHDSIPTNKIVYLKKFKPYNWYFGSKAYLEDYYDEFKKEIAEKISHDHFRYGGYVFVNELDGDPIVLDGKVYNGSFNFLAGTDSIRMGVFRQELDAALSSPDGNFFTYEWNLPGETKKKPKISFVKLYEESGWLVGAGFFLDEIWQEIYQQQQQLKRGLIRNLFIIFFLLFLVLFVESYFIYRFHSNYSADFLNFSKFFKESKSHYKAIDVDRLYFDEFRSMGTVANEMITERKKVYNELLHEQKRAQEADRLKTAFLANMSHEIRTPMNAILGFSSLLNDDTECDENKRKYIDLVQKNGESLLKLINDIIDISKIESDQLNIIKEEFELSELLKEIELNYQEVLDKQERTHVQFVLENNLPDSFILKTDKLRLKQVLDNLIGNAIKFTSEGQVKLAIYKRGNWVHFHVEDSGIGIPQEELKDIFKRFIQARVHAKKNYGGTGLGLAISQRIIHLMGGDIGVKSEPGQGSDFYFYIPA